MSTTSDHLSAEDFISQQTVLEKEARELMPWNPKKCTYEMGPLRQQLYSCRTHNNIGICYSCSIRCHTSCDIVELFSKRHFTCDCGTERDSRVKEKDHIKCEIRKNIEKDISAMDNLYGQNFKGLFCNCAQEYDPDSDAVMLQCILGLECDEDWYHDYCILGKTESESKELKRTKDENTGAGEAVLGGFPKLESFDAFICWKCVSKYEYFFRKLQSHELADSIIACKLVRSEKENEDELNRHNKRSISPEDDHNLNEYSIFLQNDYSKNFKKLKGTLDKEKDKHLYTFLDQIAPFLIESEPIHEPNEDDDELSIFDLATQALHRNVEQENAVNGILAFQALKSKLNDFLKTFAEKGEVVKEEDIKGFFQK
ncbi:hypothetical protein KAFR_0B02210 [Kazachstania africana CBS 2517]|uniref:UBR-type domain-containing protein n=1 Tax=Kazachstania africana (strain ATCC 22294 / BCRC 22015 / CBS 2517 / CECT 1963 / NBRC 1671 / NRRL Y-8276) TaxID=1071382 RepID=H2AQ69_KAZAF|nr:hypothetical protein KAFR_0B02210 [Kazachstania africana CBS 2517]CCF56519.1 hypothetical protein KAFR_0B02210 [Kazachstania africana CBS 2517]